VIACELAFWVAVGLVVTSWYDRRKLDRISPDALAAVDRAIDRERTRRQEAGTDQAASSTPGAG